jgi:hypothetical protein
MFVLASAEGVAGITAAATLTATLVLAGITALTTNSRLTKQINAEADRQERALAADSERQAAALAHDRELADIADLRAVLDEATLVMGKVIEALLIASREIDAAADRGELLASRRERSAEAGRVVDAARVPVPTLLARLVVRLGPTVPITESLSRADQAMKDMISATRLVASACTDEDCERHRASYHEAERRFGFSAGAFLLAGVARAGVVAKVSTDEGGAPS